MTVSSNKPIKNAVTKAVVLNGLKIAFFTCWAMCISSDSTDGQL